MDNKVYILQLPYFTKKFEEYENDFERWICVLKNMEILDRMPEAAKTSVFERLRQIGDVSAMTREERIKYDYALKKYRDNIAVREYAIKEGMEKGLKQGREEGREEGRKEGREEGRKEGREEGREEGRISLLNTMFSNGMPVADIARFLKMSEDDVRGMLDK